MTTFGIRALRLACQPILVKFPESILSSVLGATRSHQVPRRSAFGGSGERQKLRESSAIASPFGVRSQPQGQYNLDRAPLGVLRGTSTAAPFVEQGVTYKVAENQRERAGAFRLVYQAYTKTGLMRPHPSGMRVMPHHLLPTTTLFVAVGDDRVIATMSLVGDGRLGLPMESVYPREVSEIRQPSSWLGEVSGLASAEDAPYGRGQTTIRLMQMVAQFSRCHGLDHLLVAVHPRHAKFYCRAMGFRELGDERRYPLAGDRPAVALHLDLSRVEIERPNVCDRLFGEAIQEEHLRFCPISAVERRYFANMVTYGEGEAGDKANSASVLACA